MTDLGPKNVHRKTYGSTDSFDPKYPRKNIDSDDNFCPQDPHKNLWFQ